MSESKFIDIGSAAARNREHVVWNKTNLSTFGPIQSSLLASEVYYISSFSSQEL